MFCEKIVEGERDSRVVPAKHSFPLISPLGSVGSALIRVPFCEHWPSRWTFLVGMVALGCHLVKERKGWEDN